MKTAICPGSFDPVTLGHLDVIRRSSLLFDKVIVVIMVNPSKNPTFSVEERICLLKQVTGNLKNIEIDTSCGLLADYASEKNATAIVKGLRVMSDFESEFQMALTNSSLNPKTETIFLPASIDCMFLSSSMVRQVASHGGDISKFVPETILDDIKRKLYKNENKEG